jgi:isopentenyl diphosphate isomerase/L-lactate dehydrogenase-like FMN-dependent dehydrogenase
MTKAHFSRRRALEGFGLLLAGSPLLRAQELAGEPPGRIPPRGELVNVFEVESMAQRKLAATVYAAIAGSDRRAFDRMTFRPRMLIDVRDMDLTAELFGDKMFAPILVGPASHQQRFHPEGELATVRGAAAAQTVMVVSGRSSVPLDRIAAQAKSPLWYQLYPEADVTAARARVQQAVKAGCRAICLTVGAPYQPAGAEGPPNPSRLPALGYPAMDWSWVDRLRQRITVPLVLKGIMNPEEAETAVKRGAQGIVVSSHGGRFASGLAASIEMLPSIADAVGGKVPLLIDGSFRRGTDILKALALGARAVLVSRPPLWGLAAYGAEGVQTVLAMLQSELARSMGLAGRPNLAAIDRSLVQIHRR